MPRSGQGIDQRPPKVRPFPFEQLDRSNHLRARIGVQRNEPFLNSLKIYAPHETTIDPAWSIRKAFLLSGALLLTACGGGSDDASNDGGNASAEATTENKGTENKASAENKSDKQLFETVDIDAAVMDYSIMVKSVEFTKEFQGTSYDEYVINAPDDLKLVVANVVITNTSDEPIIPEERVINPKLTTKIAHEQDRGFAPGDDFEFDFAEEELSKELAPGEQVEAPLVATVQESEITDPEGHVFIQLDFISQENSLSVVVPKQ